MYTFLKTAVQLTVGMKKKFALIDNKCPWGFAIHRVSICGPRICSARWGGGQEVPTTMFSW